MAQQAENAQLRYAVISSPQLSWHPENGNKVITCGGGRMIVAKFSSRKKRPQHLKTQTKDYGVAYIQKKIGYNFIPISGRSGLGGDGIVRWAYKNQAAYCKDICTRVMRMFPAWSCPRKLASLFLRGGNIRY